MQFVLELLAELFLQGSAELIHHKFGRRGCALVIAAIILLVAIGAVAWHLGK